MIHREERPDVKGGFGATPIYLRPTNELHVVKDERTRRLRAFVVLMSIDTHSVVAFDEKVYMCST